jgi:CO dehydrogenase/acetyl-CoA synthase epsilon subunit
VIYRYHQVVLQPHLLIHLQQRLRQLLLVVEQRLIEHNMLDNTKQLHQEFEFVVVDRIVELLFEVVVLFDPKRK